jgi:DNA-binding CsgD family transcriptional regulator
MELPGNGLKHRLTQREIECLQWAARGKSTVETAMIFAISRRTVVFHLENAKRKLEVSTLRQAIVEGLLHRAITR